MRVVITECDHDGFDIERAVARAAGAEFHVSQSRTAGDIIRNARGADAILVQYANISEEILDALPALRAVGRYGVGVDSVDVEAATARGVAICNVPDYGTDAVAEHAVALALAVARDVPALDRAVRAGEFDLSAVRPLYRATGRTFGIIGLGRIGAATARRAMGLGYSVIGFDPAAPSGRAEYNGVQMVRLEELLRRSHVVSLHAPLNPSTHHLIDAVALARMRPDAILVNTSRGALVDTDALVATLQSGGLAGAGLDVCESEPLSRDHALMSLDCVVLTPHLAWYTEESYSELKRRTIENVIDVCSGRLPRNIVNPEVLEAVSE